MLRPGGGVGLLEFSEPSGLLRPFYSFYFHHILPHVGEWISGMKGSYSYLPGSVDRFPTPAELVAWMSAMDFHQPRAESLTGGIAALYTATKA